MMISKKGIFSLLVFLFVSFFTFSFTNDVPIPSTKVNNSVFHISNVSQKTHSFIKSEYLNSISKSRRFSENEAFDHIINSFNAKAEAKAAQFERIIAARRKSINGSHIKGDALEDVAKDAFYSTIKKQGYSDLTDAHKIGRQGADGIFSKLTANGDISLRDKTILLEIKSGKAAYSSDPFGTRTIEGFKQTTDSWLKDVLSTRQNISKETTPNLIKLIEKRRIEKRFIGINIENGQFIATTQTLSEEAGKVIFNGDEKILFKFSLSAKNAKLTPEERAIKKELIDKLQDYLLKSGRVKSKRQAKKVIKAALGNKNLTTSADLSNPNSLEYIIEQKTRPTKLKLAGLKSKFKLSPRAMKLFKGALKAAPIIIEVALDLHDFYKEVDRYYSGQLTKRDLAISLAGVAGGIAGGAAGGWLGAKAGAALGGAIGSLFTPAGTAIGVAIGGIAGGIFGSFIGYELGSYLAKNAMAIATLKYHKTMKNDYYFNNLCNSIDRNIKRRELKTISA